MIARLPLLTLLLAGACLPISLDKDHPLESYANGAHGFPTALVAAGKQVCAYLESENRAMVCWGDDGDREGDQIYPQHIGGAAELLERHSFVSNGVNYCALDSAGRAHCGGSDSRFLGPRFVPDTMHGPSHVQTEQTFKRLALVRSDNGSSIGCGIPNHDGHDPSKDLFCWGGDIRQIFPSNTEISDEGIVDLRGLGTLNGENIRVDFQNILKLKLSAKVGCITGPLDQLWCWGPPSFFGQDSEEAIVGPFQIPTPSDRGVNSLALHGENLCVGLIPLENDDPFGSVWCMGVNQYGQAGINITEQQTALVEVQSLQSGFYELQMGAGQVCARLQDPNQPNQIWCWGRNDRGQLGNGTDKTIFTPTPIEFVNRMPPNSGFDIQQIVLGDDFGCWRALGSGLVHCWGANDQGQLGQPDLAEALEPTLVQLHYRFR